MTDGTLLNDLGFLILSVHSTAMGKALTKMSSLARHMWRQTEGSGEHQLFCWLYDTYTIHGTSWYHHGIPLEVSGLKPPFSIFILYDNALYNKG